MKKVIALIMALALTLSLLCACGESDKKNSSPSNIKNNPSQSADDAVINW